LVAVAFLHFGFAAMLTSAIGLFWTALPIAIAGLLLFVWNFFSVPAVLHTQLSKKNIALETTLAELKEPPPDYAAIRHIDRLTLREAAFYWCDLSSGPSMPNNVRDWYNALASAVTKGELKFEPKYSGYGHPETERDVQKRNPQLDTMVTRKALQAFDQNARLRSKVLARRLTARPARCCRSPRRPLGAILTAPRSRRARLDHLHGGIDDLWRADQARQPFITSLSSLYATEL
jgi:hypothetical protein